MKDRLITIFVSVALSVGMMMLLQRTQPPSRELDVDRLVVRRELVVSDTGSPWEAGYEVQHIPRGLYARPGGGGAAGVWVRSRLIKCEIDDPFDDRFHAIDTHTTLHRAPGHISWNAWVASSWRQMAIIQGEGLEYSEVPAEQWNHDTHPGRLRFQTFRPGHNEPLTDALIGQGMMSLGGGGFGGGGLPYPKEVLQIWGGQMQAVPIATPAAPTLLGDDASGPHQYQIMAIGPQGNRTAASAPVLAKGRARLQWDSVPGADCYLIIRDQQKHAGPLRTEGSQKQWIDTVK